MENNNANVESKPSVPGRNEKQTLWGILAYLGPFVLVSYLVAKDDPFVKFHIKQGLVLLVLNLIVWLVSPMLWNLWTLGQIINLVLLVFTIIGIINVVQGQQKELPYLGQFSKYFTF